MWKRKWSKCNCFDDSGIGAFMNQIYMKARAKVNLTLEVLDKREDNYHNLKSVFQKVNLYDEMYIEKTDTNFMIVTR